MFNNHNGWSSVLKESLMVPDLKSLDVEDRVSSKEGIARDKEHLSGLAWWLFINQYGCISIL